MRHACSSPQRGFSLMAAVFLIVVLAAVGAFAVRIIATQQQTVNFSILEARALAAAKAGIEYGANQALTANTCNSPPPFVLSEMSLAGFTVKVTCAKSLPHTTSSFPKFSYALDSTATKGVYGKPDFVSRHVARTVTEP